LHCCFFTLVRTLRAHFPHRKLTMAMEFYHDSLMLGNLMINVYMPGVLRTGDNDPALAGTSSCSQCPVGSYVGALRLPSHPSSRQLHPKIDFGMKMQSVSSCAHSSHLHPPCRPLSRSRHGLPKMPRWHVLDTHWQVADCRLQHSSRRTLLIALAIPYFGDAAPG
jgi:hypothetical protein